MYGGGGRNFEIVPTSPDRVPVALGLSAGLVHSEKCEKVRDPRFVQKYDPTGEWDWMAYLCCGISAAITNAAVTMVVANWWIKIDAQTTGGLCVATMLLTMWLYRTPPEDIALPLGKKAAKAAAADDVDIISTLASDANPNPGAAKRATKSPKRDKAALRFHE